MLVELSLSHFLYSPFNAYFKLLPLYNYVIVQTLNYTLQISRLITSDIMIKLKQSITKIFWERWWWCWQVLLLNVWPTEYVKPYIQLEPLLEIVTIANFQHVVSRICICTEPDIRICGIKLYKNDIHNTNLPLHHCTAIYKQNYFTMFLFRLIPLLFISDD